MIQALIVGRLKKETITQKIGAEIVVAPSVQLLITPRVFRLPEVEQDPNLVAVMMPFERKFQPIYKSITMACADSGMHCQRADELWEESEVIQDIVNLIFRSRIVVVDFSGKNPNVMYETGIAHTLGRPVVPIVQTINDVPFDLKQHRVLTYLPNGEGLEEMRRTLGKRLVTLTQK